MVWTRCGRSKAEEVAGVRVTATHSAAMATTSVTSPAGAVAATSGNKDSPACGPWLLLP